MLDNTSLPDMLDALLSKRSAALDDLLGRPPQLDSGAAGVESSTHHLKQVLGLILHTIDTARTLFATSDSANSLLALLEQVQSDPSAVDVPADPIQASSADCAADLPPILHTLPNLHNLIRYLPASIIGFTPFIDTQSPRNSLSHQQLQDSLSTWFKAASQQFKSYVEQILEHLTEARQLAALKASISDFLGDSAAKSAERHQLASIVETASVTRLEHIYAVALQSIVDQLRRQLADALERLPGSAEDNEPAQFWFSPSLPFPSKLTSNLTSSKTTESPFDVFTAAIDKRLARKSPLLDECLSSAESSAAALKSDLSTMLQLDASTAQANPLLDRYREQFDTFCSSIFKILSESTEANSEYRPRSKKAAS